MKTKITVYVLGTISVLLILLGIVLPILYLDSKCLGIDFDSDKLDSLVQSIILILTGINILVFIVLTLLIEKNSQNREVENKLHYTQQLINEMRIKEYEEIRSLATTMRILILRKNVTQEEITKLSKKLYEIDDSLLFANDNYKDESLISNMIAKTVDSLHLNNIYKNHDINDETNPIHCLSVLIKMLEAHIVGQTLRNEEVEKYINENKIGVDSTICCVRDIYKDVLDKIEEEEPSK